MLRDLTDSDPLHLKHITKKIKSMARGAPNPVLETIHEYFVDNPEVGAIRALRGRRGSRGRVGSGGIPDLGAAHLLIPPRGSAVIWDESIAPWVQPTEGRGKKVDAPVLSTVPCHEVMIKETGT